MIWLVTGLMIGAGCGYFFGLWEAQRRDKAARENLVLGDKLIRGHFSGLNKYCVRDAKRFLLKNEELGLVKAVNWWHGRYR